MSVFDILLLGVALSMDACAVGLSNGMTMPKLSVKKALIIALFFGVFQGLMPLIGYYITDLLAGFFMDTFEKISSVLSFVILTLLGAKMVFDGAKEIAEKKRAENSPSCPQCEVACEAMETEKEFSYTYWQKVDENRHAVRFCTSWATKDTHVDQLIAAIEAL